MDKRIKYSYHDKRSIVLSIEKGKESISSAALRLGCSRSRIQQWLGHYRANGLAGLKQKPRKYSGDFRLRVITEMINKRLSLMETCSVFKIPNIYTVHRWLEIFRLEGKDKLLTLCQGRKRKTMSRKKETVKKDLSPEQQKLAELQAENEYLRAENAFLKKLDALMKEQEAQEKQKQERKPSGN